MHYQRAATRMPEMKYLVTSKAGDVTQSELYNEMKTAQGEQTLQLLVLEKVLDAKYEVSEKQVDTASQ